MEYFAPQSLREVLELKARFQDEALVLAGGQSLSVLMQNRLVQPAAIISIQNVADLAQIRREDGTITIGAGVTMRTVVLDPLLRTEAPILAEVTSRVASAHVRSLGTLTGNLCHAEAGSDPPQALLLLDADVLIGGARGERAVPLRDFIVGHFQTVLEPDEVATGVRFKPLSSAGFHYAKFRRRQMDLAVVGVAVQFVEDGASGRYVARIAVGGTGKRPERIDSDRQPLRTVAEFLAASKEIAAEAEAKASVDMADVFGSVAYRRHLVRIGVERGIQEACARMS